MSLRVLHVDPERGWGGGEVQVLGLLRELAARGHRSTLAAAPGSPIARAAAEAGIPVVALPIRNDVDLRAGWRLRRLARGMDVVHFHTARAHAMAPWLAGLGVRRVVTRRMDYVPAPWARWLYGPAIVDVVIAISDGVRAALRRAGLPDARIRVVPSGVDVAACTVPAEAGAALRTAWGLAPGDVAVVLVGVLEDRKGHRVLLEAARALPRAVRLVFCGSGSAEAALRAAAADLGDRVVFAGFRRDVAACLAAADVVVLPSLAEGLGVAALEAMAAGRAVVASRVGGLEEVVADGETGLLVPAGDAAALGTALARMAADPALRARCGAAGRDRVLARYTRARMADGTLACYSEAPCGG